MDAPKKTPKSISTMTDQELIKFIHKASAELLRRSGVEVPAIVGTKQSEPSKSVAPDGWNVVNQLSRPTAEDADFALMVKAKLSKGEYLRAHERERVARIAETHGEWVEAQGLPTTSSAGEWRRATAYQTAPRAKER